MNGWITTQGRALLTFFGRRQHDSAKRKPRIARGRRLSVERLEAKQMMTALYWDPNATAGTSLGGASTWSNGGAAVWYNPATGTDVAWNNAHGDAAHFQGAASAIVISGQVSAVAIVFDTTGYSIAGGTLLVPSSGMFVSIASGMATIAAPLTGSGLLTEDGAGYVTLSANNTYSGGTKISGGSLAVQNFSLPAGGNIDVSAGAVLHYDTSAGDIAQLPTTFTGGGTLLVDGGNNFTLGGTGGNVIVSFNAGALIDLEAGSLVASDSYNGQWTTNAAALNIATGATFDAAEANVRVDALTGGGTFQAGLGTVTETIGVAGGSGEFAGNIQDNSAGSMVFVKAGAGTETLSGNSSYTGPTETQDGQLNVQRDSLPAGGNLVVGNSSVFEQQTSIDLYWDPDGAAGNNDVSTGSGLGGSGAWSDSTGTGSGAAVWYNPLTGQDVAWNNSAGETAHFTGTAGTVAVSGQVRAAGLDFASNGYTVSGGALMVPDTGTEVMIDGGLAIITSNLVGVGGLAKSGAGTLDLSADNTYSGGTEIIAGAIVVQNYSLPAGGAIDVAAGATLHYDTSAGDMQQMPTTFTGSGTLLVDGGSNLTFGGTGSNVNVSFSSGALINLSSGSLTASTYHEGQWAANAAALNIAGGATFEGGDSGITIDALSGAGTLVGGSGTTTITIGADGGSGSFFGLIQNAADGAVKVVKTGSGTETLTGANSYTGGTTVDEGVLQTSMAAGRANNVQYVLSDLQAGETYEIYATWNADSSLSTTVPYEILDGSTLLGTVLVNQQNAPTGATINGVTYQSLGQFLVSGTALSVTVLSTTFGASQIGSVIAQQRSGDQITAQNTYKVRLIEADVGESVPLTVGETSFSPSGSAYVQNINDGTVQAASWEAAVEALVSGDASFNDTTVNFPDDLGALPGFTVGTVAELSNMPGNQLGGSIGLAADTKVIALEDGDYTGISQAPPQGSTPASPDWDDGYWIVVVTIV